MQFVVIAKTLSAGHPE